MVGLNILIKDMAKKIVNKEKNEDMMIASQELDMNILYKILDKQFSLVGAPYQTSDMLGMDIENQTKVWESYTFTSEQFEDWHKFVIDCLKEWPVTADLTADEADEIFRIIADQWAFEIEGDELTEVNDSDIELEEE